jgi:DNA invertase Pin-like site-specific DNA recombinase
MAIMDGYIRVSRKGERDGEEYRSPTIQREEIERWAKRNDVEIGRIPPAEENVSGAKAISDRALETLIRRVEDGVSSGIIVYKTSRFGRTQLETLVGAKRIRDAGGRLVGVSDGVDTDQESGKIVLSIFSSLAETELDEIAKGWKASTDRAVAEGKHIACRAPFGYLRADVANPQYDSGGELIRDARLVVDTDAAPAILKMFEMRAKGVSYTKIADYLEEQFDRVFSKSTVSSMLQNRAYLGEARGPHGAVKTGAHMALTTEELFGKTQPKKRGYVPRNGTLANQAMLGGKVVCDECGHKMQVMGTTKKATGERVANYVCRGRYSDGHCAAPAIISVEKLDGFTIDRFQDDETELSAAIADIQRAYLLVKEKVAQAETALDEWVEDPTISTTIGKDRFAKGITVRQGAIDDAKRELWDIEEVADVEPDDVLFSGSDRPIVYSVWGQNKAKDRKHLQRYIKQVRVAKPDPARRKYQPIEERVKIEWVGAEEPAPVAA